MPVAAITTAASVGGDFLKGKAAGDAAKAQNNASNATLSANDALLGTIGNDVNPIIGYGNQAGGELAGLLGTGGNPAQAQQAFDTFRNSTNYNFLLNQGEQAQGYLNAPNLQSGATGKALINYGQGMAGNALAGYEGLLQGQEGLGLQGSNIYANAGTNLAAQNANARNLGAGATGWAATTQAGLGASALGGFGNQFGSSYGQVGSALGGLFGGGGPQPTAFNGGTTGLDLNFSGGPQYGPIGAFG